MPLFFMLRQVIGPARVRAAIAAACLSSYMLSRALHPISGPPFYTCGRDLARKPRLTLRDRRQKKIVAYISTQDSSVVL